jgi:hypothetical protein
MAAPKTGASSWSNSKEQTGAQASNPWSLRALPSLNPNNPIY